MCGGEEFINDTAINDGDRTHEGIVESCDGGCDWFDGFASEVTETGTEFGGIVGFG